MKNIIVFMTVFALLFLLCSCGEKKTLHCDGCGKEIEADAGSNMEEDWIVYCEDCEPEIDS